MRLPVVALLVFVLAAALTAATIHDAVHVAGRALAPVFGWMFP